MLNSWKLCAAHGRRLLALTLLTAMASPAAFGAVTGFQITALPASTPAGTTTAFTVTAIDGSGNKVTTYTGTVRFTCNFTASTLPANYTFTAGDAGSHGFVFTPIEAGTQILDVFDTQNGVIYGEGSTVCTPITAVNYAISNLTNGSSLNAGVPATFDITAYDQYYNVATGYAGSAIITSSDPAATLPAPPHFTNGVVTGVTITFWTAGGQSVTATDSVNTSMSDTAWATINAAPLATITAPAAATAGATGLAASVASQSGVTYLWSITNGAITSGQGTSAIQFTAGAVGTLTLQCKVTRTSNGSNTTGSKNVNVVAAPTTPVITAASPVTASATGLTASVTAHTGMTYTWTLSGGSITSAGGASGVTSGTTNTITYTAPAAAGTLTITCTEKNAAGTASSPGSAAVQVVAAPTTPTIAAATPVTTGATGLTAAVTAHAGMTYLWTIAGGTITSAGGTSGVTSGTTNTITYTAGAVGTLALTCKELNSVGTTSAAGTKNVTVVAAPQTPTITAASPVGSNSTGNTATVTARTGTTYLWSITNGTITSSTAGVTSGGINTVTYTAGAVGTLTLNCVENNSAGTGSAPGTANVTVIASSTIPVTPTIVAASPVTSGAGGLTASVTARSGMTYTWTIAGGSITSAGGTSGVTSGTTNTITYTAGAPGTISFTCVESNGTGQSSTPGSKSVTAVAAPTTPTITTAAQVTTSTTGNTASVTANTGMTYIWTLSAGTITSAGGASGVTSGGVNTITYTAPVAAGTLTITCTEKNAANTSSAPGSATVSVVPPSNNPVTPTITGTTIVTAASAGNTASVTAHQGMTYSWTISGGSITSAGGASGVTSGSANTITYTAGSSSPITLTCVEINSVGTTSSPGNYTVTVVPAPVTPTITAASPVNAGSSGNTASVTANPGMTYSWTINGGTITSAGGVSGVTSGGTNSVTYTAGAAGSIQFTCVEINAAGTSSAPGSATVSITGSSGGTGSLFFVAHQDDDLLFENPAIEERIQAGLPVRTVFLTAAGSPDLASWQAREHGIYSSDIAMTGIAVDPYADAQSYWTVTQKTYAGKTVVLATFNLQPNVSVIFMRLPDGSLSSLWDTDSGAPFYVTPVSSLTTADGANTYTKAQVIATISAIIADFQPGDIGTQDSTFAYGDDHQDHITSALFALEAEHTYARPHMMRQFRGYNIYGNYFTIPAPEIANLSTPEYNEKTRVMVAYGGGFPAGSDYDHWCARHYAISRMPGGTGPLVNASGLCMAPLNESSASGTPVVVAASDGSLAQRWTITSDGLVQGIGGKYLTVGADGVSLTIQNLTGAPQQRWTYFSNGQLRGYNGTCLTVAGDGVTLQAGLGGADSSQNQWTVLPSQLFVQQFSPSHAWSSGTNFSDADVTTAATYGATLTLADVNGDGYADACIRLSTGVYVALNNKAGGFGPYHLYSSDFSDAAGWQPDQYGTTVQFVDVNGDGKADVVGRGPNGIVVALANSDGSAFGPATLWSSGTDFSDAAGWAGAPSYYRSIHFADVNGDGYPDACGRSSAGIVVALNNKHGGFGPASLWISNDFSDAAGWQADKYGTTIQFGDVNGDGKADVMGRGPNGVRVAVSNGTSFINSHPWSLRSDFSDAAGWGASAAYYGSLHLADVNGDGLADLCGRGPGGIVCAISNGNGFDKALPFMPNDFTDALGWSTVAYGSSIRFGDINGDGKADVIGRNATGLVGATAP